MSQIEIKYFYSPSSNGFFASDINLSMPDDIIEVTQERYLELLSAINSGCIIFEDLNYSEPKPSQFHYWDGEKWLEDENDKRKYLIRVNTKKISDLANEAENEITIINRAIQFNRASDDDLKRLESLELYTVLLFDVDVSLENIELPEKPS